MDALPPLLDKVSGRFAYKMFHPMLQSHSGYDMPPQQITIVEWNTPNGLNELQAMEGFQDHLPKLRTGTTKFELHYILPKI